MTLLRFMISFLFGIIALPVSAAADTQSSIAELMVGTFSQSSPSDHLPSDWTILTFPKIEKQTQYKLVAHPGGMVIRAQSRTAASGLIRNLAFDVRKYPWLSWRWKITHVMRKGDLRHKKGDDYAARIYVAFKFDSQNASWWQRVLHTLASTSAGKELPGTVLTYIWANQAPMGTVANNPYTDHVKMIVLQTGNDNANQWMSEKRNIANDYHQVFGRQAPAAIGIGIMTDTDNTGESTTAFYGDIILSRYQ
jgi:hypothetical protein